MIIRETLPGQINIRYMQELFEELRLIFNAESVGFEVPEPTLHNKTNYTIRIFDRWRS